MRLILVLALCAVASPGADEFWLTKPPAEWTLDECEKLLSKSPWSDSKTIARGAITLGSGVRTGVRTGVRRRRGIGTSPATVDLIIRWQSAVPMKEALARVMSSGSTAKARQRIEETEGAYVITVRGLPASLMRLTGETKSTLMRGAGLRPSNGDEITPQQVDSRRDGDGSELRFTFPRTLGDPPTAKSVEFRLELGDATLKSKFVMEKMLYQGEPAL